MTTAATPEQVARIESLIAIDRARAQTTHGTAMLLRAEPMPSEKPPITCPDCGGFLCFAPLDRCAEPRNHDRQRPGKGQWAPHVAEAVTAIEPDDDEQDNPQGPTHP